MQGTIHRSPVRIDRGAGGFGGSGADRIGRRTIHGDVQRLPSGARNGKNRNESGAVSASAHLVQRFGSRSEEHTSELQSLMRISYAVFCLKKKTVSNHRHVRHK